MSESDGIVTTGRTTGAQHVKRAGNETRVMQVVDEYLEAVERGEWPDRAAIIGRHPDIADELAACLDGLEFIRNVAPQLGDAAGKPSEELQAGIQPRVAVPERACGVKGTSRIFFEQDCFAMDVRSLPKRFGFVCD